MVPADQRFPFLPDVLPAVQGPVPVRNTEMGQEARRGSPATMMSKEEEAGEKEEAGDKDGEAGEEEAGEEE